MTTGDSATIVPRATGQKRFLQRLLHGAGVALSAGAFVGLAALGIAVLHLRAAAEPPLKTAPPVSVSTMTVRLVDEYARVASYTGRLEPARQTALAFERAGLVTAVTKDEGGRVEAGEVIARLDTSQLEANRRQLEARRRELAARRKLAELTLGRQSQLKSKGWSPEQRLDEAVATVAQLSAAIDQVTARIAAIDIDIRKSELKAPFDGHIAVRSVDEGAVVAAGSSVVTLLETDRLQARIGLPPAVAAGLSETTIHALTCGGRRVRAKLAAKRRDLQTGTRTATVLFDIVGPADGIALGDLVTLDVDEKIDERGAWVPLSALKEGRRGLWTVLVVDQSKTDAVVRPEAVEVLYARGDEAFVRGTFRDGARILTGGINRVVAGQRVALAEEQDR